MGATIVWCCSRFSRCGLVIGMRTEGADVCAEIVWAGTREGVELICVGLEPRKSK